MLGFFRDLWTLMSLEALKRTVREFQRDDVTALAAQLAYYLVLAIFPLLLFLVALLGTFGSQDLAESVLGYFRQVVPVQVYELIDTYLGNVLSGERPAPGLVSFGILATIWAVSNAFAALIHALNKTYDVEETRPFWKVRLLSVLMTFGLSVFIILGVLLLVGGSALGGWLAGLLGMGELFEVVWNLARWPIALLLLGVALALIYYFAPDVEQPFRWITPGGVIGLLLWVLASLAFSYYVNNFGAYDRTYGSIGAVIVLLLYLYISSIMILFGAELNATLAKMKEERSGKQIIEGRPEEC
ncbi:YihY/virulence factor BrkB family protein [Rubrobacter taiwanensis]|jgi:membrane protein|uniref:YihY/virulence factor BrkB family protein n=1 Tax=Rubrobacter taiwanensis TaxID=185139 RepID=A0A4R1BAC6_9ACTN|nr:YihY/virulence factor BrkB family protein [Rubrobacter taiwanensis]TCJ13899.1 YihY/virulence factor BrkB family protein [Rubrobacter taiwanensis]